MNNFFSKMTPTAILVDNSRKSNTHKTALYEQPTLTPLQCHQKFVLEQQDREITLNECFYRNILKNPNYGDCYNEHFEMMTILQDFVNQSLFAMRQAISEESEYKEKKMFNMTFGDGGETSCLMKKINDDYNRLRLESPEKFDFNRKVNPFYFEIGFNNSASIAYKRLLNEYLDIFIKACNDFARYGTLDSIEPLRKINSDWTLVENKIWASFYKTANEYWSHNNTELNLTTDIANHKKYAFNKAEYREDTAEHFHNYFANSRMNYLEGISKEVLSGMEILLSCFPDIANKADLLTRFISEIPEIFDKTHTMMNADLRLKEMNQACLHIKNYAIGFTRAFGYALVTWFGIYECECSMIRSETYSFKTAFGNECFYFNKERCPEPIVFPVDTAINHDNDFEIPTIFKDEQLGDTPIGESADIHGEPFNFNTLFANHDTRDFNRTEFLNISLPENKIKADYNAAIVQEAHILAERGPDTIQRMNSLNEAMGTNIKNNMANIFKVIENMLTEFITAMQQTHKMSNVYLTRNRDIILTNPPKPNTITINDIGEGIKRMQQNFNCLNSITAQNAKTILESDDTITEAIRKECHGDASQNLNEIDGLGPFLKSFYNAGGTDDAHSMKVDIDMSTPAGETLIKTAYNYCTGVASNAESVINGNIRDLKNKQRKIEDIINQVSAQTPSDQTQNGEKANESVFWSNIYGCFMEADANGNPTPVNQSNHQQANSGPVTNDQDKKTANDTSKYAMLYARTLKTIYTTQLAARKFYFHEYFDVLNAHISSYSKKNAKEQNINQNTQKQ